jgi:hypothetical protein
MYASILLWMAAAHAKSIRDPLTLSPFTLRTSFIPLPSPPPYMSLSPPSWKWQSTLWRGGVIELKS